jgi:hypothetical protein
MLITFRNQRMCRLLGAALPIALLLFLASPAALIAQKSEEVDNYKWRVEANWWFTQPTATFGAQGSNNYLDINKDFGFGSYSTFSGKIDYHFKHKHHFLINITPLSNTKTVTLSRSIDFEGVTYDLNGQSTAHVRAVNVAPGYEYDFIRRKQGYLGLEVDLNLVETYGSIKGEGTVGGVEGIYSSSKSFFAPLPAVGPVFRWYPLRDSNRISIDGSFRGMPFFGYGNFISARGSIGVGLTNHLALRAGYQLGSRLSIHGTSDQIALQITQKGPTAGIEYSFGEGPEGKPSKAASNQPGANVISEWHVDWVPFYLWFSGLQGNVGAKGYVVPVDVSFSQIFKQLNIGLMSVLDVRRKRVGLLTDLLFMSVSSDQSTTPVGGGVFSGFKANAKTFFVDPELYVRLLDKKAYSVDAVGGARFWRLDNSLNLLPGTSAGVTVGQTQSWVDPVLGARFRLNLPRGFFANLKGDAGGFGVGSQQTWQIYTGVGKEFKEKYSVLLGYRYLAVDYRNGGFLFDTHMSGLLTGLNIRFK